MTLFDAVGLCRFLLEAGSNRVVSFQRCLGLPTALAENGKAISSVRPSDVRLLFTLAFKPTDL